jgi:hypothetical protein
VNGDSEIELFCEPDRTESYLRQLFKCAG